MRKRLTMGPRELVLAVRKWCLGEGDVDRVSSLPMVQKPCLLTQVGICAMSRWLMADRLLHSLPSNQMKDLYLIPWVGSR